MSDESPVEAERGATVVIGVGNLYRQDDAIGLLVAQQLRKRVPAGVRVLELSGEASELMREWRGAEFVIVVDAVLSGETPGRISRFDVRKTSLPLELFRYSSHAFGVAEAIELSRTLGELPPRVIVYAVAGERFGAERGLSAAAGAGVEMMTEAVLAELADPSPAP